MLSTSFYKKLHWEKLAIITFARGIWSHPTYPSLRLDSFASAASHSRCHRRPRRLADNGIFRVKGMKGKQKPFVVEKKHQNTVLQQNSNTAICGCCEGSFWVVASNHLKHIPIWFFKKCWYCSDFWLFRIYWDKNYDLMNLSLKNTTHKQIGNRRWEILFATYIFLKFMCVFQRSFPVPLQASICDSELYPMMASNMNLINQLQQRSFPNQVVSKNNSIA